MNNEEIKNLPFDAQVAEGATVKARQYEYGNIWIREVLFKKKGDIKTGHQHAFDHIHFLAKGSGIITIFDMDNDKKILLEKEFHAPCWLKVPKEHKHQMIALEDNCLGYCMEAMREQGKVCETDFINDEDFLFDIKRYNESKKTKSL